MDAPLKKVVDQARQDIWGAEIVECLRHNAECREGDARGRVRVVKMLAAYRFG